MRSETEIRQKIVEVQLLKLPKNNPDRFYAKKLNNAVIKALEWVLQDDKPMCEIGNPYEWNGSNDEDFDEPVTELD